MILFRLPKSGTNKQGKHGKVRQGLTQKRKEILKRKSRTPPLILFCLPKRGGTNKQAKQKGIGFGENNFS